MRFVFDLMKGGKYTLKTNKTVYTLLAIRETGPENRLIFSFNKDEILAEACKTISAEKKLRDTTRYYLAKIDTTVPENTNRSAKEVYLAALKDDTWRWTETCEDELTFLIRFGVEKKDNSYILTYQSNDGSDSWSKEMTAPYPVCNTPTKEKDLRAVTVAHQTSGDMLRIEIMLKRRGVYLTQRERGYLFSCIESFYAERKQCDVDTTKQGSYAALLRYTDKIRAKTMEKYIDCSDVAPLVYLPYLDALVDHLEDYVCDMTNYEFYRALELLDYYRNYKKGKLFAGYELLPREAKIV